MLFLVVAIAGYGLRAQNNGCHANFSYSVESDGLTVQFTDLSYTADSSGIVSWSWNFGDDSTSTEANPEHTYFASGTFYVCLTITSNSGCTDTYCDTILVGNDPCDGFYVTATVTMESASGANDGSINLHVQGGTSPFSYSWNNGATTEDLSSLSEGNYCVTVTDYNGCTATDCFYVYADTSNNSDTSNSYSDTLVTDPVDTCINFTVDTAYIDSYYWIDESHVEIYWYFVGANDSTIIAATYEVSQSGDYLVLISINCGSKTITTYQSTVHIDEYTGFENAYLSNNMLKLYPNPANNYINVFLDTENGYTISIFSTTGQMVRQLKSSNTGVTTINISDLQKGVYIVKVKSGNTVLTSRFIK